jgi:nicotinate-nucleotide pyrophosphorylase (carboxylating)
MAFIPKKLIEKKLLEFLDEDIEYGDITADLVPDIPVIANLIAKQGGILCGIKFAKILFEALNIDVESFFDDGKLVEKEDIVLKLKGSSQTILTAERTALNLVMRLSGIATLTRNYVERVEQSGLDIIIAATRKTTPGFRYFEKYAVMIGGGDPHRWSLSDTILIKENHLNILGDQSIRKILDISKIRSSFSKKIDVEVENLNQLGKALKFSPEIVMLDDFSIEDIQKAIKIIQQNSEHLRPLIEVSGGISEHNFNDYLISGIHIISLGALTHSFKSIDFSLNIKEVL